MSKQFKKSKTNDKYIGVFPLEFDEAGKKDKNGGAIPDVIHLVPVGQWDHDLYGPIIITSADIKEFIVNFNAEVRKGVFITCGHEGFEELPAAGWVTAVEQRPDGLWGTVEWNEIGKRSLSDKEYKFFSPEMCRDYEDPQTHQFYRNVLTGGALTKSPYFKELQAIVFSEKTLQSKFNDKTIMKTLEEILALDIATLSDEDKAVLKEKAGELNDEQKVKYAAILGEVATTETPVVEEPKTEEPKPEEVPVVEEPKEGEDPQKMSEKNVTISASELTLLRQKADQGVQAFKELEAAEIKSSLDKLVFSTTNKAGKFLPKNKEAVETFMKSLNKAQRATFADLIKEIPENAKFTEIGSQKATDGSTIAEVDALVSTKMKANDKLSYSEALKQVMSETKGLEERYDSELQKA